MATIQTFVGFEWGTVHDVAAGNAGSKIFDGVTGVYGTNLDVVSGSGSAIGSYVGQVATISNKNFFWDTNTLGTGKTDLVVSLRFRFTTFPTGDSDFHSIDTAASTDRAGFYYEVATGKIHAWITTAHIASSFALTLNTWYTLQFKYSVSASLETFDWVLNGTTQTQVTNNLGASTIARYALGSRGAGTGTMQVDDVVISTTAADHPLPMYNVRLVKADTAGTTTEIGTANSTARFTTNNTIDSTHNSANILAAISEVPPTIGASASGVAQRAGGTSDAVSIPMTSISLSGDTIAACRVLICGWANGTLANNIGVRAWNGSAETILVAGTVASLFSNNTTDPDWFAAMYAGVTNQTALDALEIRLGYSTDIAPEPGAHAVYAEILTLPGSGVTTTPGGVASGEQFGAASVTPGAVTVTPAGITSGEKTGSPAVLSTSTVATSGVVSSEQFGNPIIISTATATPAGITSAERAGSPSLLNSSSVAPSGVSSSEQFGAATISVGPVSIAGNGIPTAEKFGSPTITAGSVTITPSGINTSEQVGNPAVTSSATVAPSGIVTGEKFGLPTITQFAGINPAGIVTSELFGAPTVVPGSVAVAPAGIPSSESIGNSIVSAGTVTATTAGIASSEQFGLPTISTSAAGINAGGVASSERVGSPGVTAGQVVITPAGIASAEVLGAAAVSAGPVTVLPAGIRSNENFGSPTVTATAGPGLTPLGIVSQEQFGSPAVTAGAVVLHPTGIPTSERVGSPSVAITTGVVVAPSGIASGERFGNSVVSYGPRDGALECKIDRKVVAAPIDRVKVNSPVDRILVRVRW